MIKLKRINEGQLDLFSRRPKELDPPKPQVKKEPKSYDGMMDTDQSKWFTQSFLNKKYDEYNRRFFNNALPSDFSVKTGRKSRGYTIGYCRFTAIKTANRIDPQDIILSNKNYKNRFLMENVLIHEMCHAYQAKVLCKGRLDLYLEDCKKGTGSSGHGPLFFKAADMVNNSPDNIEGFKITQYEESGEIMNQSYTKADGWLVIIPNLTYVSLANIFNTPTGRSQIINYNPACTFTYKDGDIKVKYTDRLGRKMRSFYYTLPWLKDVISDIENGSLIPVRKDVNPVTLFMGIAKENGARYFVSTNKQSTLNNFTNIVNVKMNVPYSKLQNLMGNNQMLMYTPTNSNEIERCVNAGVYSMDKENSSNKSEKYSRRKRKILENKDIDIVDELEKIKNVVDIEEITEDEFEITIC